jgi:hypothetical protein
MGEASCDGFLAFANNSSTVGFSFFELGSGYFSFKDAVFLINILKGCGKLKETESS